MKKRAIFDIVIILSFIFFLLMTACSKGGEIYAEKAELVRQSDEKYVCSGYEKIVWEKAPNTLACYENIVYSVFSEFFYENQIIDSTEIEDLIEDYDHFDVKSIIFRRVIGDSKVTDGSNICEIEGFVLEAVVAENADLILLTETAQTYLGIMNDYFVVRVDENGNIKYRTKLEFDFTPSMLTVDGENAIYIVCRDIVYCINKQGKYVKKIEAKTPVIDICACKKKGFYVIRLNSVSSTEIIKIQGTEERIINLETAGLFKLYLTSYGEIVACNSTNAWVYSEKNNEWQELWAFQDMDICFEDVKELWFEQNLVHMIVHDSEENTDYLLTAKQIKESDIKPQETITVGIWGSDGELQHIITRFNRMNEQFRVEVIDYSERIKQTKEEREAVIDMIARELISGRGPDILCTNTIGIKHIADQNVLIDLSQYVDNSKYLCKNDFYEELIQSATYDNKLIYLPYSFNIWTVIGKMSVLEDVNDAWISEDIIRLAKGYSQSIILESNQVAMDQAASAMFRLMYVLNEDMICEENSMNEEIFEFSLNKAKEIYQTKFFTTSDLQEAYREDKILLKEIYLSSFMELPNLGREEFGDVTVKAVGYPNSGIKRGHIMRSEKGYGITVCCEKRDCAWKFLEYLMTAEPENLSYFSARSDCFGKQMRKMIEYAKRDMNEREIRALDQSVELLDTIVREAVGDYCITDDEILSIMYEEVQPFYRGDKTAEETIKLIRNRVSLYISENKK